MLSTPVPTCCQHFPKPRLSLSLFSEQSAQYAQPFQRREKQGSEHGVLRSLPPQRRPHSVLHRARQQAGEYGDEVAQQSMKLHAHDPRRLRGHATGEKSCWLPGSDNMRADIPFRIRLRLRVSEARHHRLLVRVEYAF
jgi:hypothetical protein